ncbi:MAG TPA: hypothetical protein VL068_00350 [Microthrixaceae bacterium]|nr:hypothetical protein [Microthrixaceae bacterium]
MGRRVSVVITVVTCAIVVAGCTAPGNKQATASLRSEKRVVEPPDDAPADPFDELGNPDDFAAGMEEAFGSVFGETTETTVPTGSSKPSAAAAALLNEAVEATLAEPSMKTVVRQETMGMKAEIRSISSSSGDRSESIMNAGLGLSTFYRYVDGTVYVRQEGAGSEAFGVDLDKWARQAGDPEILRNQMEGMTGLMVLRQLPSATEVGPADPARIPAGWDVEESVAFVLIATDIMGGKARSSGLAGIRDGRIVEVQLTGDSELRIAGRSSDQWLPFKLHASFLDFGVSLDSVITPPPEELAD